MNRILPKEMPATTHIKSRCKSALKKTPPVLTQQSLGEIEPGSTDRSLIEKTFETQQLLKPSSTDRSLCKESPLTRQLLKPKSTGASLSKKNPAIHEPKPKDALTHEQMRVASHSIRDGEVLKVVALAGKQCTASMLSQLLKPVLKNN